MIYFFFQAEDGIRDIGVTGVQTCALPISIMRLTRRSMSGTLPRIPPAAAAQARKPAIILRSTKGVVLERPTSSSIVTTSSGVRSEERRVGKECRIVWAELG